MGTSHWITRFSAVAAIAVLAGCGSAQRDVSQAAVLGDAGIALAETLPAFYDAFFVQAVEADSLELAQQREAERDSEVLIAALEKSNEDFGTTIEIIADLDRHAALLRSYFIAFKALSSADAGGEIPGAAKNAVEQLGAVGGQIAGQKIPGTEVAAILEPLAAYAVTVAKGAALRAEFEARGALINREIALQEQVVGIVTQRMIADRKRVLIETTENPLTEEFITNFDRPLPGDWWRRRADYLRLVIEIQAATRAEQAVRNLRIAWESMAAGSDQSATVEDVIADLNAVSDLIEKLAALRQ